MWNKPRVDYSSFSKKRTDPDGPVPNDLALFGETPGPDEWEQGQGFVGRAGQELWAGLERFCGLSRGDFYVSNVVKDWLLNGEGHPVIREPKPAELARALPEVFDEIERVKPKLVVAAGGTAVRVFLSDRPRLSDVHGIPHNVEFGGRNFVCLPTYHPSAGLHNKSYLTAFAYDLKALSDFRRGLRQVWAPSPLPMRAAWLGPRICAGLEPLARGSVVAVDTEGWLPRPVYLSFSVDGKLGVVIKGTDEIGLAWFSRWIADKHVVMQNGIHDLPILRAVGTVVRKFDDTQVLAFHEMLRTGSGLLEAESQNLSTLAYRFCGLRLKELADIPGVDFTERIIPVNEETMTYAGEDPCATWRIYQVLKPYAKTRPYQIDMGQVGLVESMIATGLPFDLDATIDVYAAIRDKLEVITAELQERAARLGNRDFNPGSHPQVRDLIVNKIGIRVRKRTKGGVASTSEKALADHQHDPFVRLIQKRREFDKLRGTYLAPLVRELMKDDQ